MNILYILIILLVGCAAPMEQLISEAKECVATAPGIVGEPTDEQRTACWAEVNKREEESALIAKRKSLRGCCIDRNGRQMMNCKCLYQAH
jgi:hypothetical protein